MAKRDMPFNEDVKEKETKEVVNTNDNNKEKKMEKVKASKGVAKGS